MERTEALFGFLAEADGATASELSVFLELHSQRKRTIRLHAECARRYRALEGILINHPDEFQVSRDI